MRIAVCEIHQETDSFNPIKTTLADYIKGGLRLGDEIFQLEDTPTCIGGTIAAIKHFGGEIIPLITMTAQSGGTVEHEVVDYFFEHLIPGLKANLPLDGVFIALHGATQSDTSDDVCGDVLATIREIVGPDCVITASTDLHANITEKMVRNADYISGYQTYPHVDFFQTGYRSSVAGLSKIMKTADLKMAWASVPMIAPASSYTTIRGAFKDVMDYALSLIEKGELSDVSIFQMQPWLDVNPAQSSILTIAPDAEKAKFYANDIAYRLFNARYSFSQDLYTIDQVLDEAEKNDTGKPFAIIDSSDSPNAGATGDSAALVGAIKARGSDIKAGIYLNDDPAVARAFKLGVGAVAEFTIGGSLDPVASEPVTIEARVVSLHDGFYMQEGPAQRGYVNDIGRTAVLHYRNTDIILCHNMFAPGDPQAYRHFGIEPTFYQLVNIKACTSWRAAYEPMAGKIFETDTPGNAPLNLMRATFTHLPKHFYPFEDISEEDIKKAEIVTA